MAALVASTFRLKVLQSMHHSLTGTDDVVGLALFDHSSKSKYVRRLHGTGSRTRSCVSVK
eukprot:5168497-Amphidinium_carterae.2